MPGAHLVENVTQMPVEHALQRVFRDRALHEKVNDVYYGPQRVLSSELVTSKLLSTRCIVQSNSVDATVKPLSQPLKLPGLGLGFRV